MKGVCRGSAGVDRVQNGFFAGIDGDGGGERR